MGVPRNRAKCTVPEAIEKQNLLYKYCSTSLESKRNGYSCRIYEEKHQQASDCEGLDQPRRTCERPFWTSPRRLHFAVRLFWRTTRIRNSSYHVAHGDGRW